MDEEIVIALLSLAGTGIGRRQYLIKWEMAKK